jgi:redox-sensing transcriptional repressor
MEKKTRAKKGLSLPKKEVPMAVIRPLPRYHRFLGDLLARGQMRVSSAALSELMDVTASQIRQDLNCFGGFGQQGYGYNVEYLYKQIGELLGINEGFTAVIMGAGNLGRALVSSHMFERRGVTRLAMFDVDPAVIGKTFGGVPVLSLDDLETFAESNQIDIGVLTTPKDAAESAAKRLADLGVKGIWNFSIKELCLPDHPETMIENIHMGDSLMLLSYALKSSKKGV